MKRHVQRIRLRVDPPPDALGRHSEAVNYFDVFLYGEKEIVDAWSGYNDKLEMPLTTVVAQVIGRLKVGPGGEEFNNITLRVREIKFHYGI